MTEKQKAELAIESTGDEALDTLLGGGIPAQSVVVVAGEPGAGKTVLVLQMLFRAARRGKKGLYVMTLSEPALKLIRYMQLFDFFDADIIDEKVFFADIGSTLREGGTRALEKLVALVEEHEPSFVAIDSFRALGDQLRAAGPVRPFIYDLAVHTASWGATTLLVGEYTREELPTFAECAVADGIIRLGSERQELTAVRQIEILKMRGRSYVPGRHFFEISSSGASVFPRVRAPDLPPGAAAIGERAPTGIEGLDQLVDGGFPRGSSTIVQGGTGAGKTLLGLQFLVAGARAGERGVLFTQEETPEQLRAIARTLGWDLAALEESGRLAIKYTSPVEMSTDRYLYEARREVAALGARRAVFDSLTTLGLGVASERRFKEMIYSIVKHMRGAGVTTLLTNETEQLLGSAVLSDMGVSFIADNIVQLRYVEIDGRLERAISVLKARGVHHGAELRSLTISEGGLQVTGDRFKDMRGVLTGLPSRLAGAP